MEELISLEKNWVVFKSFQVSYRDNPLFKSVSRTKLIKKNGIITVVIVVLVLYTSLIYNQVSAHTILGDIRCTKQ